MKFSYLEYRNIIKHIQQYLEVVDFANVTSNSDNYCVVRHDVEFSPYRALEIAKLENNIGISSSFYFQITNNCYNSLSNENLAIIKQIEDLGHKIGAHINTSYIERVNKKELSDLVQDDVRTLSKYTGIDINRYSFHRPTIEQLECYLEIDGLINAYDKKFFYFCKENIPEELPVTYLADSNHQWKWGYPMHLDFNKISKLQLNTHPFSWTNYGYGNINNYKSLVTEKNHELVNSINNEIKNFPKELLL